MKKMSVLIVDDAIFMRFMLKKLFEAEGECEVIGEASNGFTAIEQAKILQPDIVTMDVIMPDLDGIHALKEILKVSPKSKVIMVTSVSHDQAVNSAIGMGAFDYLTKPADIEDIRKMVRRVMISKEDTK